MINKNYSFDDSILRSIKSWNRQYTYPEIDLWKAETWAGKYSPVCQLANQIGVKNNELVRGKAKLDVYDGRTDGVFDAKTGSVAYPDVIKYWDDKGLYFKATEMGGVCWIAMVPHEVRTGENTDPKIVVVLHDADFTDQNWVMNTIEYYHDYNEIAAQEGLIMLFVVSDGIDETNRFMNILQELAIIFRLKMNHIFLDVSSISQIGQSLKQLPEAGVESIGTIPVLNITGKWQNKVSLLYEFVTSEMSQHPAFDLERHVHSACGRKMAEAMNLEYRFEDAQDPAFLKHWKDKSLRFESHDTSGQQWISLTPDSAFGPEAASLPVMLIFQEVTSINPYQPVVAMSSFYEYCDLAAQGELMLLFFALESVDDNDLFMDILHDAANIYPIDLSRVYVTGHSHNGHFTGEFMRRHHKEIAAVATLGMAHGLLAPEYSHEVIKVTDDMVNQMMGMDVPLINIIGIGENEFTNYALGTQGYANAVQSWQRRLKAFNCPMKTDDEITAAKNSPDYATRMVGVPNDGSEIQFKHGCECYIANIKNEAGKHHLRLVTLENLPHICAPQMPELSWDFVRRFARDLKTGEVIELY
jgi:hypothetical protein